MTLKSTHFRANLYRVLDRVLETGEPVVIERRGRKLKIVPVQPRRKLRRLEVHRDYVRGDPDALIHVDWSGEWKP